MRHVLLDEALVGPQQPRQVHLGVVHAQLVAFADEHLSQRDERAFAQIVGAGLEAQADEADLALASGHHLVESQVEVRLVAGQDGIQHGQLHVALLGQVRRGAQVLGQAAAAEGEAGLEVSLADVELRVLAHQVHDFESVDAQRTAQPRGFIREGDLQRMKIVAGVLHHLGRAHRGADELARQVAEQCFQPLGRGFMVGADDGERRLVVVADRAALAQELGLEAQEEVDAVLLARLALDDRAQHVFHGAGHDGAAEHHHVRLGLAGQGLPQLGGQAHDGALILAAIGRRGRAHADQADVAAQHGGLGVGGDGDATAGGHALHELDHALFHHRRLAGRDELELGLVDVHADDLVAVARQAGQRHGADVAKAKDTDLHAALCADL